MPSFQIKGVVHVETPLGYGYAWYITENGFLENDEVTVILLDGQIKHFTTGQIRAFHNGTYRIRWEEAIKNTNADITKKKSSSSKATTKRNNKSRGNSYPRNSS